MKKLLLNLLSRILPQRWIGWLYVQNLSLHQILPILDWKLDDPSRWLRTSAAKRILAEFKGNKKALFALAEKGRNYLDDRDRHKNLPRALVAHVGDMTNGEMVDAVISLAECGKLATGEFTTKLLARQRAADALTDEQLERLILISDQIPTEHAELFAWQWLWRLKSSDFRESNASKMLAQILGRFPHIKWELQHYPTNRNNSEIARD